MADMANRRFVGVVVLISISLLAAAYFWWDNQPQYGPQSSDLQAEVHGGTILVLLEPVP